ncbi:Uma2 family endonuclease [Streptomyces longwoodensis]|uniref:Uma2 family endonuclease n=1 Tax=Streptomyces longwoodensis TaxID=68231 RepID=UPI00385046BE
MTERTIYRHLRELRSHFTPPPGFTHPEISDGTLVMTMSPRPRHQLTAVDIRDQLTAQLPGGLIVAEATDTDDESLGTLRIPDVLVVPRAAMETDDPLDPREIVLAIEIVSPSNPDNDYRDKSSDYPAMGIPHYLILDPRDGTWTYQWGIDTCGGRPAYGNRLRKQPYGTPLAVVTDIGTWKLDTGALPRYSRKDMMLPPAPAPDPDAGPDTGAGG